MLRALYIKARSLGSLCLSMEALASNMQNMDVDQQQSQRTAKRSLVEEFFEEEVKRNKKSMSTTRLELARAENRKEKINQNLMKTNQRAKKIIENMREQEAALEAVCEEISRLTSQLKEDSSTA